MKVAFIASGFENLGIEYLSASLKKDGHDVRLFFDPQIFGGGIFLKIGFLQKKFDLKRKIIDQVIQWRPDIIGFSCMTHNYHWCLEIASELRRKNNKTPIIFGGIHPTSVPDDVLSNDCVDMVAVGESERSFGFLLKALEKNDFRTDIGGIYFKKDRTVIKNPPMSFSENINDLPYPDKKLFFNKMPGFAKINYSIMASRGCPYSCSYCCNDLLKKLYKGDNFRRERSVDSVISELKHAKDNYSIKKVFFYDEVFPFKAEWIIEFSQKYKKEIDLPFKIYYHFKLTNEECIRLLKEAGCNFIIFGLQSASEKIRREVCNRYYTNDEVRQAVAICRKYDIEFEIDHIFGLPFETENEYKAAVEFYRELSPNIIYSYWLTYYPATSIIKKGLEAGLLTNADMRQILEGENSFYHKGMFIKNKKELLSFEMLFDLIPLLPASLHKKITNNRFLLKIMPKTYLVHFFLLLLASFRLKDNLFMNNFKLLLSKKNVP